MYVFKTYLSIYINCLITIVQALLTMPERINLIVTNFIKSKVNCEWITNTLSKLNPRTEFNEEIDKP